MKPIELEKSIVSLSDEGIMYVHIKADCEIELSDAILIIDAIGKIGGGKKYPVLIDAGEFSSVDKETRVFSASIESNIYSLADAYVHCNLAQKILVNFYIKYNKPAVPTEAFYKKAEALEWLKTFVK